MSNRRLFLFLDYDGTLVPIRDHPGEAVPSGKLLELLRGLASCRNIRVAIVSGRGIGDLKRLLTLENQLYLVGCHGGIVSEPGGEEYYTFTREIDWGCFHRLYGLLQEELGDVKGIMLEKKEISLALHYRLVEPEERKMVEEKFYYWFKSICFQEQWELLYGNQVWELRPRGVNKGKACLQLLDKWPGAFSFYAGDDFTDEDAFQKLRGKGETVLVGEDKRPTSARRRMSREELWELLCRVYREGGLPAFF